jgi:tRNA threonylcarbamoyl adenosine modification protein YeaZ
MKILALEFSSEQRSVAVLSSSDISEVVERGGRNTNAIGMIAEALRNAKVEREQIECLAIGIGPGSYTGIRVAIALAQGWQLARGVKLLGISSAESIAAQAREEGLRGLVQVVIDAQREEFYRATYELTEKSFQEIAPLRIVSMAELREGEQSGEVFAGPEVTRWFPDGKVTHSRAATLSKLAATRTDFVSGEKLEPIYLRQTTFVKAPPMREIPGLK